MDARKWTFPVLICQYLENYNHFHNGNSFDKSPFKTELKKLNSVLYAFTGINYNVESEEGRDKIKEIFDNAFGLSGHICEPEKLIKIEKILPVKLKLFLDDVIHMPRIKIGEIYSVLFNLLWLGFQGINYSVRIYDPISVNIIISAKKKNKIDENEEIIFKAIMILLGDDFKKSFLKKELIENYKFPIV